MIFYNSTKTLDLHGETREFVSVLVNEFLEDCYHMQEDEVIIIHGIGQGIVKKEVQNVLKKHPKVDKFYIDFWNLGQTVVKMKKNVDK